MNIGDIDDYGYILRDKNYIETVQLWETPAGYYVVYLFASDEHYFVGRRKYREGADALFDSACNILQN